MSTTTFEFINNRGEPVKVVGTYNDVPQQENICDLAPGGRCTKIFNTPLSGNIRDGNGPNATLAEFTLNAPNNENRDTFNLSVVQGFNGGTQIAHSGGFTYTCTPDDQSQAYQLSDDEQRNAQINHTEETGGSHTVTFL